jgi:iron complex transport system ATP-binding protein
MARLIFEAVGVSFTYPDSDAPVIRDVSLGVGPGELVGIVGPNGSGKTTLLRLFLGLLQPKRGSMCSAGRPTAAWSRREFARLVGVVTQREEPAFPLRVHQAVRLGRFPHVGSVGRLSERDRDAVERAMSQCDVTMLRDRWVSTLSGGEWQRVRIARALAQEPQALVLDEPTASLDVRHEMEVFELTSQLVREQELAGVVVTHQINLAARFADRLVLLDRGRVRAIGSPNEVLQPELLEEVFAWPVTVHAWRSVPQFVPLRKSEAEKEL